MTSPNDTKMPNPMGIGIENITHVLGSLNAPTGGYSGVGTLILKSVATPTCYACAGKINNDVVDTSGNAVDLTIQLIAKNASGNTVSCSNIHNPNQWGAWIGMDDSVTEVVVEVLDTSTNKYVTIGTIGATTPIVHACHTIAVSRQSFAVTNQYALVSCSTGSIFLENKYSQTVYLYDATGAQLGSAGSGSTSSAISLSNPSNSPTQILTLSLSDRSPAQGDPTITVGFTNQDTVDIQLYDSEAISYPMVVTPATGSTTVNVHNSTTAQATAQIQAVPSTSANIGPDNSAAFDMSLATMQWVLVWDEGGDPKVIVKKTDCGD